MKSKHCQEWISLLNQNSDDKLNITTDCSMTVVILRIIILWASHSIVLKKKKLVSFVFSREPLRGFFFTLVFPVAVALMFFSLNVIYFMLFDILTLPWAITRFIFTDINPLYTICPKPDTLFNFSNFSLLSMAIGCCYCCCCSSTASAVVWKSVFYSQVLFTLHTLLLFFFFFFLCCCCCCVVVTASTTDLRDLY